MLIHCGDTSVLVSVNSSNHEWTISLFTHSSVVTARLPSGVDPITKLERGGSTAEDSAKCVFHALKAVRDGGDPTMAIKDFITQNKISSKDSDKEQEDLANRLTKIVISDGEKTTPAKSTEDKIATDSASEEIEALKEENRQLREEFETIQEEHKAKVRECQSLLQERVKMGKIFTRIHAI